MLPTDIRAVADAVLLEGYVLYPYRSTAPKNSYRWTTGVLAPRAWSKQTSIEPWWMETQCLIEGKDPCGLGVCLRFLQVESYRVQAARPDGSFADVPSLEAGKHLLLSRQEAATREVELECSVGPEERARREPFRAAGAQSVERVENARGELIGRMFFERMEVRGELAVRADEVPGSPELMRLTVRVENLTDWTELDAPRDRVIPSACVGVHILMSVSGGSFVSMLDPPEQHRAAAAACKSVRTFPVLAGKAGTRDRMLSSPIILYDHPLVAPESKGDFHDACEIDEILTLRTLTLTDEEKRAARASGERAAAIIDRVESMSSSDLARLHGAIRDVGDGEMVPRTDLVPGRRVRLVPKLGRADAHDVLYAGRTATIERLLTHVDGRQVVAVSIDDDPASEIHKSRGVFHHYELDEVELLPLAEGAFE